MEELAETMILSGIITKSLEKKQKQSK